MGRKFPRAVILLAPCLVCLSCNVPPAARYVYQDGDYGVIGIPRNTSLGKVDFRQQAIELMYRHFPEGFEIVRAEEVVEGERVFEAARKLELDSEPGVSALNQMIKVGKFARSTSLDQKDTVHITESRIIYRRKDGAKPVGHDGFTPIATLSPELYLDPNETLRKMAKDGTLIAKKDGPTDAKPSEKEQKVAEATPKNLKDPEVQKASMPSPK